MHSQSKPAGLGSRTESVMRNHSHLRSHGTQGHPDIGGEAGWEQSMLQFWFWCRSDSIPGCFLGIPPGDSMNGQEKIQSHGLPREGVKFLAAPDGDELFILS